MFGRLVQVLVSRELIVVFWAFGITSNVTGTRTNNLLDGLPTLNAYADTTAISVGYAVQSGVVLEKSGNYWYRIGTSQAVDSSLTNRAIANIVPIGTTSKLACSNSGASRPTTGQYWSGNSCTYNSATGLYYDGGAGQMNWGSANNHCANKGMRLPALSETSAGRSGGIPNYSDLSWTSTVYRSGLHYNWSSSNYYYTFDSVSYYVRCVVAP